MAGCHDVLYPTEMPLCAVDYVVRAHLDATTSEIMCIALSLSVQPAAEPLVSSRDILGNTEGEGTPGLAEALDEALDEARALGAVMKTKNESQMADDPAPSEEENGEDLLQNRGGLPTDRSPGQVP